MAFDDAIVAARETSGARGYLAEDEFRKLFHEGRITTEDLESVIARSPSLSGNEAVVELENRTVSRGELIVTGLVHRFESISPGALNWQLNEKHAQSRVQEDVPGHIGAKITANYPSEAEAVSSLWSACMSALGIDVGNIHPEDLFDLIPEQAERILSTFSADPESGDNQPLVHKLVRKEAAHLVDILFGRLGTDLSMRDLLLILTGEDLLEQARPMLIRHLGLYLDLGTASWRRVNNGFLASWKTHAASDLAWLLDGQNDAADEIGILGDSATDIIELELQRLGIPRARWQGYLERVALQLPGWAGMFLWRSHNARYDGTEEVFEFQEYLAVVLVLERLLARNIARRHWMHEAHADVLRGYFSNHRAEFIVRYNYYMGKMPEYLASSARQLVEYAINNRGNYSQWVQLADRLWTWRHSKAVDHPSAHTIFGNGWKLFRLCQHLGLNAADANQLDRRAAESLLDEVSALDENQRGFIWLQAYEIHYRDRLFAVLTANHNRGRWKTRDSRPQAQIIFCMDDREESIRRHLEEHNPQIETLGAAGFFGVAINWRGLDDNKVTPLCPVVVKPSHQVDEYTNDTARLALHRRRRNFRLRIRNVLHQELRRNLFSSVIIMTVTAPLTLFALLAKSIAPGLVLRFSERLRDQFDLPITTDIRITANNIQPSNTKASPENPRHGFTDEEQADRVEGFLRTIGLAQGFAQLVVMMGHGSGSQNNPHLAAYDCGACSGRHGGPNARAFAAMANRAEVRQLLQQRNIVIPDDTWFLGAEHNTCDDSITWYDIDDLPGFLGNAFDSLDNECASGCQASAHERCRRLASAPKNPDPQTALKHVIGRYGDISQARPELGHATNACAFIGRRSLSQGAFFDRRAFLISYDSTTDPTGEVLERILLAAAPVGAGINLEYYFSTVNNDEYGCGSKITHNVTGMFAVMDGASSDLRTGLPKQMIEIHEAMRLQVIVEARTDVLAAIYGRQPELQELVGNGWLLLSAIDPDTGAITVFSPATGFVPWKGGQDIDIATTASSTGWYAGHSGPLPFALIDQVATK